LLDRLNGGADFNTAYGSLFPICRDVAKSQFEGILL